MDEDTSLLQAIRKLDQPALISVFDQFAPRLFRYALRMCGDPITADDIVGEVFRKLLEALKTGKGPNNNLRSYLYQTTYHELVNQARTTSHQVELTDDFPAVLEDIPHIKHEDEEEKNKLLSSILTYLNEDQRHVIDLRFFEDFSIKETAEILGKNINNIKVIQNRAITKLRQVLEK
jgi:RNA polymerase sigma-70 factor, ECF subfamily